MDQPVRSPHRTLNRLTLILLLLAISLPTLAGCASALQAGSAVMLDAKDLVSMTDQMAASIAADPDVAAEPGPLRIVIEPVENRLRGEVLPRGQAELFTARVREQLADMAPERFLWVNNRDTFYALADSELDLGPTPGRVQPTHVLKGVFSSLADERPGRRSAYYLCTFDLADLRTGTILWTGQYEVRKQITRDYLD